MSILSFRVVDTYLQGTSNELKFDRFFFFFLNLHDSEVMLWSFETGWLLEEHSM